jgi:hypothetical protein
MGVVEGGGLKQTSGEASKSHPKLITLCVCVTQNTRRNATHQHLRKPRARWQAGALPAASHQGVACILEVMPKGCRITVIRG